MGKNIVKNKNFKMAKRLLLVLGITLLLMLDIHE